MAWKELKQQSFADALQASNRFIEEFDEIHDLRPQHKASIFQ